MRTRSEVEKVVWKGPRLKPILISFALIQQPEGCCSLRFVPEKIVEASSDLQTLKVAPFFCTEGAGAFRPLNTAGSMRAFRPGPSAAPCGLNLRPPGGEAWGPAGHGRRN